MIIMLDVLLCKLDNDSWKVRWSGEWDYSSENGIDRCESKQEFIRFELQFTALGAALTGDFGNGVA